MIVFSLLPFAVCALRGDSPLDFYTLDKNDADISPSALVRQCLDRIQKDNLNEDQLNLVADIKNMIQ